MGPCNSNSNSPTTKWFYTHSALPSTTQHCSDCVTVAGRRHNQHCLWGTRKATLVTYSLSLWSASRYCHAVLWYLKHSYFQSSWRNNTTCKHIKTSKLEHFKHNYWRNFTYFYFRPCKTNLHNATIIVNCNKRAYLRHGRWQQSHSQTATAEVYVKPC